MVILTSWVVRVRAEGIRCFQRPTLDYMSSLLRCARRLSALREVRSIDLLGKEPAVECSSGKVSRAVSAEAMEQAPGPKYANYNLSGTRMASSKNAVQIMRYGGPGSEETSD
jgi:hypothetical protein